VLRELQQARSSYSNLEQALFLIEKASVVISTVETEQQKDLRSKVENLITYGLQTVFQKPYRFVVQQDLRGHQTDTTFCVQAPEFGEKAIPLKDAHGGGLVVFCAFLLRFIILMSLRNPNARPFMALDEQFMAVSPDYRDRLVAFLKELVIKADLQLLLVTHDPDLVELGDKCYRFKIVAGLTQVEKV
jgi:hypothetical protein